MKFKVLPRNTYPPKEGISTCYLEADNWNDYSFVTTFCVSLHDENGVLHKIGNVRIGFVGQTTETATYEKLDRIFDDGLPPSFFSLGMHKEYYEELYKLDDTLREKLLNALRDVVFSKKCLAIAENEDVFSIALLRDSSITVVKGKYSRLLAGLEELTPYDFAFIPPDEAFGGKQLEINVVVDSTPSTNIHAIIGKNGTGKTTFLNDMVEAIINPTPDRAKIIDLDHFFEPKPQIDSDYFSSITSVSFSAFDTFIPPKEQSNPAKGTCYFYVGLKKQDKEGTLKTLEELREDLCESMLDCFYDPKNKKLQRFIHVVGLLSFDQNIKSLNLEKYHEVYLEKIKEHSGLNEGEFRKICRDRFLELLPPMSSGHAIVLLSTFNLIATVDDKSLVLIDEPESHLHPPLLAAFIRALSWLLHQVNGVSIIATHSPVVLQEVPRNCVWKVMRSETETTISRPEIETFGENVGILTREVFGLDVDRSGFITVLRKAVDSGRAFDDIYRNIFNKRIGAEGLTLLRVLVDIRDSKKVQDD
ncbi:AAA family ATPase [Vibrio breoganii]